MASNSDSPLPLPTEFAPSGTSQLDHARASTTTINVSVKENNSSGKKRYQITLTETGSGSHIENPIPGHGPTILVPGDTIFLFVLDSNIDWSFTDTPLSFGDANHARFYTHKPNHSTPLQAEIHARHNAGGDQTKYFKFSFNVNMMQENGTPLLIKIDPEVRNPPPHDFVAAPLETMVLL